MPQALIPILISAGVSSAPLIAGTSISAASIIAYSVVGAAVIGGGAALNAMKREHTGPQENQVTIKQALPARRRVYGRAMLGGALFFCANTADLIQGIYHCEGPISAFEQHWFNDTLGFGGEFDSYAYTYPWNDKVHYSSQLGGPDQTVNPLIQYYFPYWWTSAHRCRGAAVTAVSYQLPPNPKDNLQKVYPSGAPAIRVRVLGSFVFDPRDPAQDQTDATTWTWSANAALCILDYLTHADGFAIPFARINVASFIAMADLCDEPVPLARGGTEARYTLNGTYDFDEEPRAVLRRMLAACDGEVVQLADGTLGLRGGAWTPPTVTIDETMVVMIDEARQGNDKLAAFNQLRIGYVEPFLDWQLIEAIPYDDLAAQEASQEVLPQQFDLPMVLSYTQARRLAKIAMAKGNPLWQLTLTTTLAALNALGDRTVHVTLPDLAIDADFFVGGYEIAGDGATCKLTLASLSADAYEWSTAEEAGGPPPVITPPPPPLVPDVIDLEVALVRREVTKGVFVVAVDVAVPADPDYPSLSMHAQLRKHGDTHWADLANNPDNLSAESPALDDGDDYDVRAAYQTFGGTDGAFAATTITATADTTAPAACVGLAATQAGGVAHVTWTHPASVNVFASRLLAGATDDIADASPIATLYGGPEDGEHFDDAAWVSGRRYFALALNRSGVASAADGPVQAT